MTVQSVLHVTPMYLPLLSWISLSSWRIFCTWRVPGCDDATCLQKRSTSFKAGLGEWFLKLSSLDLSEPGDYKMWVSEVFGYAVKDNMTTGLSVLKLPTKRHPYTITVESSGTKKIVAGALGVVAVASLCGVLWFAKNNRAKLGVCKYVSVCRVM